MSAAVDQTVPRCIDADTAAAYVSRALSDSEIERVDAHLARCGECRVHVSELVLAQTPVPVSATTSALVSATTSAQLTEGASQLEPGTRIDRYVVEGRLGAGGMGVVYAAHDTQLRRRVALKMVREELHDGDALQSRLLREAQAMARLSDRNVVAIYDLLVFGGRLFIAMEYIDGVSLKSWLGIERPSWQKILQAFAQAGRGLTAAHAVGLVHRDFKPSNVMRTVEGRVCVTDFGLARASAADDESVGSARASAHADRSATWTGMIAGTPAYMAPEQRRGDPADERSDQYSFCVSLYEALFNVLPPEQTPAAPGTADGAVSESARVPARVVRVIARGLHQEPARRHTSMRELVDALNDAVRPRWRRAVPMAAAAGLLAATVLGTLGLRTSAQPQVCAGSGARIDGVWNEHTREEVHQAFAATGAPYAEDEWRAVARELDAYTATWSGSQRDACEATRMRRDQTEDVLALRTACLDRQRTELGALVQVFQHPDAKAVVRAASAVNALPSPESCSDWKVLASRVPPPSDAAAAARVQELRARVDEASAQLAAGRYDEVSSVLAQVQAEAKPLGYAPLDAEILGLRGRAEDGLGRYEESVQTFYDAIAAAEASHQDDLAAKSWANLTNAIGFRLAHVDEALRVAAIARAAVVRAGGDARLQHLLFKALGNIDARAHRYDDELVAFQQGYENAVRAYGADSQPAGNILGALGTAHEKLGHYEEAREKYRASLEVIRGVVGNQHPDTATALENLGVVSGILGRYTESATYLNEALAISEATSGRSHPRTAEILSELGNTLAGSGHYDEAARDLERAWHIADSAVGATHTDTISYRMQLANSWAHLGRVEEALRIADWGVSALEQDSSGSLVEALAARGEAKEALGPSGVSDLERAYHLASGTGGKQEEGHVVATTAFKLGAALRRHGDAAGAVPLLEHARTMHEQEVGGDHPWVGQDLLELGMAKAALSDRDAVPLLERALAVLEHSELKDPRIDGRAHFALAKALWAFGGDRPRAQSLAMQAREAFDSAGKPAASERAQLQAWIASAMGAH